MNSILREKYSISSCIYLFSFLLFLPQPILGQEVLWSEEGVGERPAITFRRSGKNAGTAFLQQNRLNFHPILYKENSEVFIREVVPHEVSHLLVWILFGRVQPHGKEWQSVMRGVFDCSPSATHQFDVKRVSRSFSYKCDCDTYFFLHHY